MQGHYTTKYRQKLATKMKSPIKKLTKMKFKIVEHNYRQEGTERHICQKLFMFNVRFSFRVQKAIEFP